LGEVVYKIHNPVLLHEVIHYLAPHPQGVYLDATVGDGGHAAAICKHLGDEGFLLGIDRDKEALQRAGHNLKEYAGKFKLVKADFSQMKEIVSIQGLKHVDGILMDLGVSSLQIDRPERGFSYQQEGPLDMRMDYDLPETAEEIVNNRSKEELAAIFKKYGEERWAKKIASYIENYRKEQRIQNSEEMVQIIKSAIPAKYRQKGGHPAKRCFQALRIEVNRELEELKEALNQSVEILKTRGKICVISYHSLEDRMVKQYFQSESSQCNCPPGLPVCVCEKKGRLKVLTKKPVKPSEEEIKSNPRAKSARLRVAQKEKGGE